MEIYTITVDGISYEVTVEKKNGNKKSAAAAPIAAKAEAAVKNVPAKSSETGKGNIKVTSGTSGKIWKIAAAVGDTVKKGDTIVIVEAMKMEIPIVAGEDGVIASIDVNEGDSIETGAVVATLN